MTKRRQKGQNITTQRKTMKAPFLEVGAVQAISTPVFPDPKLETACFTVHNSYIVFC